MSFSNFGLAEEITRAVTKCGYDTPTPIQSKAIPAVLTGRDLLAAAQTGTGKTAGFVLPILELLKRKQANKNSRGHIPIRALILTPTRELAAQVEQSVRDYSQNLPLKSLVMFGGVGFGPQARRLRGRVDVLVSTPGRLLDHIEQGTVDLSRIEILVLDEADRMLDMGFIRDIRRVLALLPKERQSLLFSATFSKEIKVLAQSLLFKPTTIEVAGKKTTADLVSHKVYAVDRSNKRHLLAHLIKKNNWHQVLVFTRTKHGANRLTQQLCKQGIPTSAIHGDKSQNMRTRALADFKNSKVQVLVATDIAARGIDISKLPLVINFELPNVPSDYVHRIGRTGRAGLTGEAISLVCIDERAYLADIEKLIRTTITREIVEGYEPENGLDAYAPDRHKAKGGGQRRPTAIGNKQRANEGTKNRRRRGQGGAQSSDQAQGQSRGRSNKRRRPRQRVKSAA